MNPHTIVYLEEGASIQLETVQIRGVDHTKRYTRVELDADAEAVVTERLLTHGEQFAESKMDVVMKGEGARTQVISRSVAQDSSTQVFYPQVVGDAPCFGHVQCDSIIMDEAKVNPRGGHRQDRRGPDPEAHDPGADGGGGRTEDLGRLPAVKSKRNPPGPGRGDFAVH